MIESREILSPAKFNLRGWEHTGVSAGGKSTILEEENKVPVLGLIWKPNKDTLSVNWEETSKFNETPITKRKILSAVHRIFDPIGFTCPVTLKPKILLQECWKLGVTWDTELPFSISRKFEKWKEQLKCLNNLEIPRCISKELSPNSDLSLHVFCDASKTAYASCVFLRTEIDGTITCQLVQARARVAPIKAITIPRLELLACTIGSRLVNTTKSDLGLEDVPICCWVQEIRRLTNPEDWKHIAGILNPADLPSRGCSAEELTESLWWEGPSWLKKPREEWPLSEACPDFVIINSKRIYWPLAKVMKLIPGRDGRVRVVEVSTGGGSFLRLIQRLYPLEVSGADKTVWQKRNTKTVDDRV
ncbi:hypothetical protein AVEN_85994-1 [Araneus ventricosus]|uniref:DUF5641 domain-containing protein n=1 Tax=Araneus ventricosus TaxID=182803 RepID=A0A4Y2TR41_ARAVE|nr:hypothetical protein AVEN_85994-1 [Araneus ventricosus]